MGRRRNRFSPVPYHQRSRQERKLMYIRTKNQITRAAPALGGRFYSRDYLHGANAWADIVFLSACKNLSFFNVMLMTAHYALSDRSNDEAFSHSIVMRDYPPLEFRPAAKKGFSTLVHDPSEDAPHEVFDGLTRRAWIHREQRRLIASGEVSVRESVELDYGYAAGTGLHVIINAPAITPAAIEAFIDRFRGKGEQGWDGEAVAIDPEQIGEFDHVVSNAIVDPLENPPVDA